MIKSAILHTVTGVPKVYVYGVTSNGQFFVYEHGSRSTVFATPGSHTETIFNFVVHPSFANTFASISADATVKIWRDGLEGL